MKRIVNYTLLTAITFMALAQEDYSSITNYPDKYTAGTITARMLDGLGFRYYWATDSLRPGDLSFKPSDEARTSEETLNHILGLTQVILNASLKKPHQPVSADEMTFEEKRAMTLGNIRKAADIFRAASDAEMKEFEMVFQRQDGSVSYPLWNLINGPIADALWHVGQVVSFRRSSGNPFNSKVSVLNGSVRD